MSELVLEIKNEEKKKILLDFLEQIDFIEVKNHLRVLKKPKKSESFRDLFGIWKGRDISLEDIRKKAWKGK